MRGFQLRRITRRVAAIGVGAAIAGAGIAILHVPAEAGQSPSHPPVALIPMAFGGYTFQVPRSWPVINLSEHRNTCVRFDRHAIYIGKPWADQACPARADGTTQALLIQPAASTAARSAVENPVARRISVTAPRIQITATFSSDPGQIDQILRSASLPEPTIKAPTVERVAASKSSPDLPASATSYRGRGFDSCTAPSRAYMSAWRSRSPYRAIGVYIGGSDRACAQPNLTRSWLRREASAGWHFFPMYVGPQAAYGELSSPTGQAAAAAADAVRQAERLGFPAQTPIYYDMEAYAPGQTGVALRFLSGWTVAVHKLGYDSGVYSSSLSGIEDLAKQYFGDKYTMPDVIYDALWNDRANTRDSVLGSVEWAGGRRLHQYRGNVSQSYGGDAIDVDEDYLNVSLPPPGGTTQASPSVKEAGGVVDVFYRGSNHKLWRVRYRPGKGWGGPADLGGSVRSAPSAVVPSGRKVEVYYQGTNGKLWQVTQRSGKAGKPVAVTRMGVLGGPPEAVTRPGGIVDVVWRGSADPHAWLGQFSPSKGWEGPRSLGGTLASAPSPVEPVPGRVEVFWEGTDRKLWHVTSGKSRWGKPVSLGMGPLGGAPRATAEPNGSVRVLWHGSGNAHLWLASATESGRWSGPRDLGGQLSLTPFPVAPPTGAVRVFWRGRDGRLWQVVSRSATRWRAPARLRAGQLGAGPFAAVGTGAGAVRVFWQGSGGALWSAALRGGAWGKPVRLGGHVA